MPLPSGTVTFLFTDVEGSTRLLERHPTDYRAAIAGHLDVLQAAVAEHRGSVFETVGDAVYAAFASPRDAVLAALQAQRSLSAARWGQIDALNVRMGLHTGDAELQGEHYFGAALYRCARLTRAAHGGQILLSSATAALAQEALPAGATLHDRGEHRLKDLQRAERIFELVAPGLRTGFPPLRTLAHPNNLPVQPTPFIGREQELPAARRLLQRTETRVVTLTGPGGVGKTRLGLQVAAEVLHEFEDGVFFVPLAPILSADLVMPTIAKTLGVQEAANRSTLDGLKDYLRERRLLVVLDNFEHVIAAGASLADLLEGCSGVKALVTSREPLRLRGEQQFAVPPLAVPDRSRLESVQTVTAYEAVRLFIERAQGAKLDFAVSEPNAYAIAEICCRLDGLPLAIELAAARTKVFSPQALLARLEHRLSMLTSGPRDLPARQQTLRQAIGWSYDLLTSAEQALHRRLGVFVGGHTLAAAEAVVGGGAGALDAFEGLTSLVDKSLVQQETDTDGEPRFRMLEVIREYAVERLTDAGELDEFQRRHAEYFLAYAEAAEPAMIGASQGLWLDRAEKEHDNLRAALQWFARHRAADAYLRISGGLRLAAALRRFWRARGYLTEGRERTAALLSVPAAAERSAARAKALHTAGWLASQQGDYAEARARFEESLAIYRELSDARGSGWALVDLGFLTRYQGDYAAGRAVLDEALSLLEQARDPEGMAAALGNLGMLARDQGHYGEAEARLQQSLTLWRDIGDRVGFGWTLMALGMVARAQGKGDLATERLHQSLAVWHEVGDRQNGANVLNALAALARDQGDCETARGRLLQSLEILEDIGDRRGIAFVIEGFACLAAAEGQAARALALAAAAGALRRIIGAPSPPAWRLEVERSLATASATLPPEAIEKASASGRAMTVPEALVLARRLGGRP